MKNNISTSIHKCRADSGQIHTNQNGSFAVIAMGDARLFFESSGDMVSMAQLLMDLAEELYDKQKGQDNG